jgi:hypothetical protein
MTSSISSPRTESLSENSHGRPHTTPHSRESAPGRPALRAVPGARGPDPIAGPRVKPVGFGIDSAENLSIPASFDGVVSPIVSPRVKPRVLTRNRLQHAPRQAHYDLRQEAPQSTLTKSSGSRSVASFWSLIYKVRV